MAHESFEDDATARLMNDLFVNIKVDREERPDLDRIYQSAHHLLARRPGGWPLTMFLAPDDLTPFFGGTYFPRESRHGLPAFRDLLAAVADFYHSHREDISQQNTALLQALEEMQSGADATQAVIGPLPLDLARRELQKGFDADHGGFGRAPKFPHPSSIERLLRHYAATAGTGQPDEKALAMAEFTLDRMALGGVYDQLGGGFCRYSVDDYWMIPHFEKMLYDNGPLLSLYAQAWQITGKPLFHRVAVECASWILEEMQSPEGGYYSSLDADSEGKEGKFYVWRPEQVKSLLEADEYRVVSRRFGLDREPNFEGHWHHLHVFAGEVRLSGETGLDVDQVAHLLGSARQKLAAARRLRVPPGRDEKILTSWNGLMIKGMAIAGQVLGQAAWVRSAERALDYIRGNLWREGRLLATARDGRAHLSAYLDDYAFLIDGILALLQARWREGDLNFALELAQVLLDAFEDKEAGGFYFTAEDHEKLIQRPKPMADEAIPAGNGVAAHALGRLGHLLGEQRYLDAAQRTITAGWPALMQLPHAHNTLLTAVEEHLYPPQTIVLRGEPEALRAWHARCTRGYAPRRLTLAIPSTAAALPGLLSERAPRGEVVAYRCEGFQCGAPITEVEALEAELARTGVPRREA